MKIKLETNAIMPTRAHSTDAGLDLYSPYNQEIHPRSSVVFDTGVHIELPKGTAGLLVSKSGLSAKFNLMSSGLIDEGYTGSIRVQLYNHSDHMYNVKRGDKISQLVVIPILTPDLELVDELESTERGDKGFGSSGR